MAIKPETLRLIQYFWMEKGDLSRMSGWDEIQKELLENEPGILIRWFNYEISKEVLTSVIAKAVENAEEEAMQPEEP